MRFSYLHSWWSKNKYIYCQYSCLLSQKNKFNTFILTSGVGKGHKSTIFAILSLTFELYCLYTW